MKVYLITKNKEVIFEEVSSRKKFFTWNEGVYRLESSCVRLSSCNGKIGSEAELIFVENNPFPINSNSTESEVKKMFNEEIVGNDIESVAHVAHGNSMFEWLRNLKPEKAAIWITLGGLGIYLFWLWQHGGF